jgi:hypothetical protein
MTDNEWDKIRKIVRELWPEWMPAEAQRREYEHRIKHRQADTVEHAIRDHFAMDESFKTPTLARIIQRCSIVAEDKGQRSTPTAEARAAQRESDRDDAIALESIRKWTPERRDNAIAVAVAAGCIQDIPRHDPEAWTRHERGFIAAADWMTNTQPNRVAKMLEAKP